MSGIDAWVNGVSGPWWEAMARGSWQGGLAIVAAWGVCGALGRWLGGKGRSWVWRMGYGKFLVSLMVVGPVALAVLPARRVEVEPRMEVMEELPGEMAAAPMVSVVREVPGMRAEGWVMVLWSVGVAASLGRMGWGWRRMQGMRMGAKVGEHGAMCERLGREMGMRRVPEVRVSEGVRSPVLVGWWRPVIVLPLGMEEDEVRMALVHELGHVKRRDLAWNWLEMAVGAVFFFHPLVWWGRRQWRLAQELACDELALTAAGVNRGDYGRMLVEMVGRGAMGAMGGVGIVESRNMLKRRLVIMKDVKSWSGRRAAGVLAMLVIVGIVGLVPWKFVEGGPARGAGPAGEAARGAANPPATGQAIPVFTGSDPGTVERSDRLITQVIPLKNLDAVKLRNDLAPLMSADAVVSANSAANSLIITDTAAKVRRLMEVIQGLEKARGGESVPSARAGGGAGQGLNYRGMLSAPTAKILAPREGTIEVVRVKDGQKVKEGDVLYELSGQAAFSAYQAANQRVNLAKHALDTAKATRADADVTAADVALSQAVEAEAAAQRDMNASKVRAPFDGVLKTSDVTTGQYVTKGAELTQAVKVDELRVDFSVPQDALGQLHVGQKGFVRMAGAAPAGASEAAFEITYIAPVVDSSTGTVIVRARVMGQSAVLRSGMICEVGMGAE